MAKDAARRFSREFKLAALRRMQGERTSVRWRGSLGFGGSISTLGWSGIGLAGRSGCAAAGGLARRRLWR